MGRATGDTLRRELVLARDEAESYRREYNAARDELLRARADLERQAAETRALRARVAELEAARTPAPPRGALDP